MPTCALARSWVPQWLTWLGIEAKGATGQGWGPKWPKSGRGSWRGLPPPRGSLKGQRAACIISFPPPSLAPVTTIQRCSNLSPCRSPLGHTYFLSLDSSECIFKISSLNIIFLMNRLFFLFYEHSYLGKKKKKKMRGKHRMPPLRPFPVISLLP